MRIAGLLAALAALAALPAMLSALSLSATAQTVKVTPLGGFDGERTCAKNGCKWA